MNMDDEEETTVSDEESTTTRHTTALVLRVFSPRRSRGPYKFTHHDYQTDALSLFLSVQVAQVAGVFGVAPRRSPRRDDRSGRLG